MFRLRAVLVIAVALTLAMLIIVYLQSRAVQTSQQALSEGSAPFLIATQQVQSASTQLSSLNRGFGRSMTDDALQFTNFQMIEAVKQAETSINTVANLENHTLDADLITSELSNVKENNQKLYLQQKVTGRKSIYRATYD